MRLASLLLVLLVAAPAAFAQSVAPPPGAYRSAAAYARHRPQPAGIDATYPDKRGQVVVTVPQGPGTTKLRLAPDSVWGYVTNRGRSFRIYRGQEYQLVHADTLSVYTNNAEAGSGARVGSNSHYYFSRGLTGLIFPLTLHYLREAYAAGSPAFVAALGQMPFHQSLADYDRKTGLYRVTAIYQQAVAH